MPSKQRKNNKGFTIIEVVLVLAIAGLIFLMVFVAFPALQRSQNSSTFAAQDHTILVVLGAKCDGEATVASAGLHDIAFTYKRDGGGTICIAN